MKRLILCLIVLLLFTTGFSQRLYFVYIQSETEEPFAVKIDDKIYSSSASGYSILSKLRDSSYNFKIIFAQNKYPEQRFKVDIKANDHGYLLKNFGDKGWGLFDLQTMAVQMSTADLPSEQPKTEAANVSAFTDVLSKAANDPTLKQKPIPVKKEEPVVAKKEEPKPPVSQPVVVNQPPVTQPVASDPVVKNEEPKTFKQVVEEKKDEAKPQMIPVLEYKSSVVKKKSEISTSEGFGWIFIDEYPDGTKDTIRVIIPRTVKAASTAPKEDKKFLDITADTKDATPATTKPVATEEVKKPAACTAIATENDFLKLRKKMVAESNDDEMVSEAAKYFKSKCYTVTQVKNLGTLFLNDAGKYKFYDAAYQHVSDADNFASLQSELKDEYYINRFKAMLK